MNAKTNSQCFDNGLTCGVGQLTRDELGTVGSPGSDFLATFSHELRNSLGVIRNASQLAPPKPQRE